MVDPTCIHSCLQATEADWDDLRQRLEMRERELVEAAAAVQEALERAQDGAAGQAAWELRVASLEQQAEEERQRADGHERAARVSARVDRWHGSMGAGGTQQHLH